MRHRHVASLGSIALDPSPADRIAFWTKLHQRLAGLGNRMDDAARGAILAAVHARVPMPTLDDTGAVQINNAREDARFWQTVSEMHAATVEESKVLAAKLSASIAKREAIAAETAAKARAAADRLAKIEQGVTWAASGSRRPTPSWSPQLAGRPRLAVASRWPRSRALAALTNYTRRR